jgi:hypothetical protein
MQNVSLWGIFIYTVKETGMWRQILTKNKVEYWIYDVTFAKDIVELGAALRDKRLEGYADITT